MEEESVAIGTLRKGARFALIDSHFTITGTVLYQAKGHTSVKLDRGKEVVLIEDREFEANKTKTTEWSTETRVYKLDDDDDDGEKEMYMDSVPIDGAALTGAGEPIPVPRKVATPLSLQPTPKTKEKKEVSEKKNKIDEAAKARLAKAKANEKERKKNAKSEAGPKTKEPKTLNKCRCGCGDETPRTFRPGHDARFYGWAKKVAAGKLSPSDIPNASARGELATKAKAEAVLANSGH